MFRGEIYLNSHYFAKIMSQTEVQRIKQFFADHGMKPAYLEHEAVITSQDAAKTRGFELKQGIKAILLTNETDWVIANIPADQNVDFKKVADNRGWSKGKIRMATPDEVMAKTGCEIGAVPPFCHKEAIQILVDKAVYENQYSTFNIGLRTQSVKIKTELLRAVFQAVH